MVETVEGRCPKCRRAVGAHKFENDNHVKNELGIYIWESPAKTAQGSHDLGDSHPQSFALWAVYPLFSPRVTQQKSRINHFLARLGLIDGDARCLCAAIFAASSRRLGTFGWGKTG